MIRHLLLCLLLCATHGCLWAQQDTQPTWLTQTQADLVLRQKAMPRGHLFDILDKPMTIQERQAMQFIYAYMPAGDIADYQGTYFLSQVRAALKARQLVPWQVPDDVFRHFVLPVRVNNENLDTFRSTMQDTLLARIKGKSLCEAILEINHWCHERVTYQPSDARTSSPLSTIRTAWGRCGEESTLLVAALRTVGIPARQVYTPRWAHTDDNHAWVEAWADGQWHFLGACEPEPVLDLGWFNAPASHGMLMHTKVFGRYHGPEEVMRRTANYTEINVIAHYAPSAPLSVMVTDGNGHPMQGARVEFRIYNYAEFYPVSVQYTGADGMAHLSAGLGDMLVIASLADRYGVRRVSFGRDSVATLMLDHHKGEAWSTDIDITPPAEHARMPKVTARQRRDNDRRLAAEDSVRMAYRATFMRGAQADIDQLPQRAKEYVAQAEGNWRTILSFLQDAQRDGRLSRALDILSTLTAKDLRDVASEVLYDVMQYTADTADVAHVLAPRVAYERLVPYRRPLTEHLRPVMGSGWGSVSHTLRFCRDSITLCRDSFPAGTYTSPLGVMRSRCADERSLGVFFVALCRTQGIPAWIDGVTGHIYCCQQADTMQVDLTADRPAPLPKSSLQLTFAPQPYQDNPEYYTHFTLSRMSDEGSFALLNYDEGSHWADLFEQPAAVGQGYYLLTTGTRLASGSVLAHLSFFSIDNSAACQPLVLRQATHAVSVIGSIDSEGKLADAKTGRPMSILQSAGRGYFVVGLLGVGQEPTNHALRDIAQRAHELEAWGRRILLVFASADDYQKYLRAPIDGLPSTVVFGIDTDGTLAADLRRRMRLDDHTPLPQFVIGDTFNRVVFESHGYTIGLGDQLLKTIHGL